MLISERSSLKDVLVFDPKYKRSEDDPVGGDLNKMHAYRDGIRAPNGERVVSYAGIVFPGQGKDWSGQIGAISGIPGCTSPSGEARKKVFAAILSGDDRL